MNKTAIGVIVTLVAILFIGGLVILSGDGNDQPSTSSEQSHSDSSGIHTEGESLEDEAGVVETSEVSQHHGAPPTGRVGRPDDLPRTWRGSGARDD